MAPCHVWFGQATYTPPLESVARETITWTEEAEAKMERVPEAARAMVRMAILRLAQESGHTVITSALIDEATARFCPEKGGVMDANRTLVWSRAAARLLDKIGDPSVNASMRLRAEKRARRAKSKEVLAEHVQPFLDDEAGPAPVWGAAALARLARVPDMVRNPVRRRIEAHAREAGAAEITVAIVEAGIAESRRAMEGSMRDGGHKTSSH